MPRQVYRCPKHKEFEVTLPFYQDIPKTWSCGRPKDRKLDATCGEQCPWVPSAPNFIGGPTTGAKKE